MVSVSFVILGVAIVSIFLIMWLRSEHFHCPATCCSKLPNTWNHSGCNDPFNWGDFYTTGPNPQLVDRPYPKLESREPFISGNHYNSSRKSYTGKNNYSYS